MRPPPLASLQCRAGPVLLIVIGLCYMVYYTGVQSKSDSFLGLLEGPGCLDMVHGDTEEAQWKDIWETHAPRLYKVTRLKTLLDSKRKLLKFQPDKEYQFTAGVDLLLAQSLIEVESVTGLSKLQERIKRDVSERVEEEILRLQFPKDCQSAKKLICDLNRLCGFACQIHHVAYCLTNALALNRTMVLQVRRQAGDLTSRPSLNPALLFSNVAFLM